MRSRKSSESEDLNSDGAGRRTIQSQISGTGRLEDEREIEDSGLDSDLENEENLELNQPQSPAHARHRHQNHHHGAHHHHHHHHHGHNQEHVKELIKPDLTVRAEARARVIQVPQSPSGRVLPSKPEPRVATVVDDKQLHRRFLESRSNRRSPDSARRGRDSKSLDRKRSGSRPKSPKVGAKTTKPKSASNSNSASTSSSSSSSSGSSRGGPRSPPPAAIVIPASVAKSLSARSSAASRQSQQNSGSQSGPISLEQLEYGPLLKSNEVQVLFRSPDSNSSSESGVSRFSNFICCSIN